VKYYHKNRTVVNREIRYETHVKLVRIQCGSEGENSLVHSDELGIVNSNMLVWLSR